MSDIPCTGDGASPMVKLPLFTCDGKTNNRMTMYELSMERLWNFELNGENCVKIE